MTGIVFHATEQRHEIVEFYLDVFDAEDRRAIGE